MEEKKEFYDWIKAKLVDIMKEDDDEATANKEKDQKEKEESKT